MEEVLLIPWDGVLRFCLDYDAMLNDFWHMIGALWFGYALYEPVRHIKFDPWTFMRSLLVSDFGICLPRIMLFLHGSWEE
jgi:hypothetical protein